ncbi:MAG: hypothetical protein IKR17_05255 [Bacteroidales bacterium]|nr:hypothetical protein [Bacteroidales bacterium]
MKLKTTKYFKRVETDAMGFMLAKGVSRLYLSITLMVLGRTTISIDKVCKRAYAFFFTNTQIMTTKIHIGHAIRDELKQQRRSASWLATELNCDRTNVYDIFNRTTIDTELLARISEILHFDFFNILSHGLNFLSNNLPQSVEEGSTVLPKDRNS